MSMEPPVPPTPPQPPDPGNVPPPPPPPSFDATPAAAAPTPPPAFDTAPAPAPAVVPPVFTPGAAAAPLDEGPLSPDGLYRWDGQQWVPRSGAAVPAQPVAGYAVASTGGGGSKGPLWIGLAVVVLAAAIVAAVLLLANHNNTASKNPTPTPTASAAPTDSSQASPTDSGSTDGSYTDPQSLYSVTTFQGTPKYSATTTTGPNGESIPYAYAEYADGGSSVDEFVGVITIPSGATYSDSAGLKGIADELGGTVASTKNITFEGNTGIDGIISTSDGQYVEAYVIRSGTHVYVIGALGEDNPPDDFGTFISGVTLTPHS